MSVDSVLDGAFTLLLQKSMQQFPEQALRPATINFCFGSGGQTLSTLILDPLLAEVPFPSVIVWARMYAGDASGLASPVVASMALQWTRFETFGGSTPLNGTGLAPALNAQASVDVDLTGWNVYLNAGDLIVATVNVDPDPTARATWVALTIRLRPTDIPLAINRVIDDIGNQVVDNNGNPAVIG